MAPRSSVHSCILFIITFMFCLSSAQAAPVASPSLLPYSYPQPRSSFCFNDILTAVTTPSLEIYRALTTRPRHTSRSSIAHVIHDTTSPASSSDPSSSKVEVGSSSDSSRSSSRRHSTYLLSRSVQFEQSSNGTVTSVFDSSTLQSIAQSSASDGSGTGLWGSVPTIIWLVFSFTFGVPMALAGVRGWRFTVGSAVGLTLGMTSWAALVNTLSASGISDLPLTLIVLGFVLFGFGLGLFPFMRVGGVALLGVIGGMALGLRIIIVKDGLLVSSREFYFVNWIIVLVFAAAGGAGVMIRQRIGILLSSASVGTFLTGLGIDLIINDLDGWSRGLRFLFDRNTAHLADTITNGYHPAISSQIIIAVTCALIPLLALIQNRIFRAPFNRDRPESWILQSVYEDDTLIPNPGGAGDVVWPHGEKGLDIGQGNMTMQQVGPPEQIPVAPKAGRWSIQRALTKSRFSFT